MNGEIFAKICSEQHSMIQWFDPSITKCPLCDVMADLARATAEAEKLRGDNEAAWFDERIGGPR